VWPYVISLGAGILIGVIYSMMGVHSPAPPVIALFGLLGILIGENGYPILKGDFKGFLDHHHPSERVKKEDPK